MGRCLLIKLEVFQACVLTFPILILNTRGAQLSQGEPTVEQKIEAL